MNIKTKCLALFVKLKQMLNYVVKLIAPTSSHTCTKPNVSGSGLRLVKYTSELYVDCGNLLLKNRFVQTGDYVFTRQNKEFYSKRHFCLYHFYSDGLCLNIYYPSESFILIKDVDDMQKQIDRFNDEYIGSVTA